MTPDSLGLRWADGRPELPRDISGPGSRKRGVWIFAFMEDAGADEALRGLLSADERQRAQGFVVATGYRHYVQTRAVLRLLLGQCLGRSPRSLVFDYGPFGKPALRDGGSLRFNVAHSGGYALLALADEVDVGVDLEKSRSTSDLDALASLVFSAREMATWSRLPPAARTTAFFESWTAKEAVVKAVGRGLGLGLPSIELDDAAGRAWSGGKMVKAGESGYCQVFRIRAPEGYEAALALQTAAGT